MSAAPPMVPLLEVAHPVERREALIPGKMYRQVGVRLWGEGAYERDPVDGGQTKYKTLSRVESSDIIVNKIWARNGSVAVVSDALAGCYGSNEFPTFSPVPDRLDPQWFHWITKTRDFWTRCDEQSRGTSGKNRIRPEKFLQIEIPLPPLSEQRRIVARIEELAGKVEEARGLRRQAVEETEALTSSIAAQAFDGFADGLRNHVRDICEVRGGIQKSTERTPGANARRYITVAHVQRDWIDTNDERYFEVSDTELGRWRLHDGDVLVIEGNGSADQIGRAALFRGEIEDCVHQNHVIRVRPDKTRLMPDFLNIYFNSSAGRQEMLERSRTTSGLFNLSVGRIKQMQVPVPSLEEQHRTVAYLEDQKAKTNSLKQLQDETDKELEAMTPSILDRAFAGKL